MNVLKKKIMRELAGFCNGKLFRPICHEFVSQRREGAA